MKPLSSILLWLALTLLAIVVITHAQEQQPRYVDLNDAAKQIVDAHGLLVTQVYVRDTRNGLCFAVGRYLNRGYQYTVTQVPDSACVPMKAKLPESER